MHTTEHEKTLKLRMIKTVKHELVGTKILNSLATLFYITLFICTPISYYLP